MKKILFVLIVATYFSGCTSLYYSAPENPTVSPLYIDSDSTLLVPVGSDYRRDYSDKDLSNY